MKSNMTLLCLPQKKYLLLNLLLDLLFSEEVFALLDPDQQLEPDLLPKLIQYGRLAAHRHEGSYYTVDTRKDLVNLETDIQKGIIDWI